jgi:hypothetical protein
VPIVSAGYLSGDTASHLVAPCTMGRMAAVYALDICSSISGICGPLPERMASGVVKKPKDFFDDFFIVCHFWGGFAGGGYAASDGMLNRRFDEGDGR